MLVLKKKFNLVVEENTRMDSEITDLKAVNNFREELIKELEKDLEKEQDINKSNLQVISKLEGLNCKLNAEKTVLANDLKGTKNANLDLIKRLEEKRKQVNQLEDANHELHQELEQYQNRVVELEKELNKYKKTCDHLGNIYNSMNRKLWANHEAQRQIRNLSVDVLESDRINKAKLLKYLQDLSMLIGGGESFAYAGLKDDTEEAVG